MTTTQPTNESETMASEEHVLEMIKALNAKRAQLGRISGGLKKQNASFDSISRIDVARHEIDSLKDLICFNFNIATKRPYGNIGVAAAKEKLSVAMIRAAEIAA